MSAPRRLRNLLLLLAAGSLLPACQTPLAPVERTFLRLPARYSNDLSAIQRSQWLKKSRRDPAFRILAAESGSLQLPAPESPDPGLTDTGALHAQLFAGRDPDTSVIALHWQSTRLRPGRERLQLIQSEPGRFTSLTSRVIPADLPRPVAYRLTPGSPVIHCCQLVTRSGRPELRTTATLTWNGSDFTVRRH